MPSIKEQKISNEAQYQVLIELIKMDVEVKFTSKL
jgi:hypothetical protein